MTLLYDSLNDVEGLQTQLEALTKGLASFNRATGEIEVSAFNRMRLKTAAGALGIDYQELIGTATAQARRDEVARQLQSTTIPQEYRELLADANTELILTKAHNTQLQCIIRNKDNEIQKLIQEINEIKKQNENCLKKLNEEENKNKQIQSELTLNNEYETLQKENFKYINSLFN